MLVGELHCRERSGTNSCIRILRLMINGMGDNEVPCTNKTSIVAGAETRPVPGQSQAVPRPVKYLTTQTKGGA